MNRLDRIISTVAPRYGMRRMAARVAMQRLSAFDATKPTRRNTRRYQTQTADDAVLPTLRQLTAQARDMVRNNPYARAIVNAYVRNVIGRGIMPVPMVRRLNGDVFERANESIAEAWHAWASDPELCDLEARSSYWQAQTIAIENLVAAGEHIMAVWPADNPSGVPDLKFQILDPEQLDDDKLRGDADRPVRGGVEVDPRTMRPVAYWIRPIEVDPLGNISARGGLGGYLTESVRVPAEFILHVYMRERAGQTRGYSWLAPVIPDLQEVRDFDNAHLWAAKMEASVGLIIERATGGEGAPPIGATAVDGEGGSKSSDDINIYPGMVADTAPGESVKPFTPSRPGNTYEPFIRAKVGSIAAGVNLSYAQVARDFHHGNFSSQRQSAKEDQRFWQVVQQALINQSERPVYRRFVAAASLKPGVLPAEVTRNLRTNLTRHDWRPQPWEMIDPAKETRADVERLKNHLSTMRDLIAARGGDWREHVRQLANEDQFAGEQGITLPRGGSGNDAGEAPGSGSGGGRGRDDDDRDDEDQDQDD